MGSSFGLEKLAFLLLFLTALKILLWESRSWLLLAFQKPPACRVLWPGGGVSPAKCRTGALQRASQNSQRLSSGHSCHLLSCKRLDSR